MEGKVIDTMFLGSVRCQYSRRQGDTCMPRNFKEEAEAAQSSATLIPSYQTTRRHIAEPQVSDIPIPSGPMSKYSRRVSGTRVAVGTYVELWTSIVVYTPDYLPVVGPRVKRQAGRRSTVQEPSKVFYQFQKRLH
jgi:hypothetical protein